jgi:dTDP-4-dehydrorhamnose 3,5-epimerase
MKFLPTPLAGVFVIELERFEDDRGAFARIYDPSELEHRGLDPRIAQCSLSWNHARGTLRGMHYQIAPHEEAKTVRAVAGAIFDVAVDLRGDSPTRGKWFGIELTAANFRALHIPAGLAHGFLTLEDASVVHYQISTPYVPDAHRGIRWDDPAVAIDWPFQPVLVNERDRSFPLL